MSQRASDSQARWLAVAPETFATRRWDDEYLVHTEITGATHLLASLAGDVLDVLVASPVPLTSVDVARRVLAGPAPDAVDDVLLELERIRLVAACPE